MAYTVNNIGIYSENFSGENVIVNLNVGNYYSINGVASFLWNAFSVPVNFTTIIDILKEHYANIQNVEEDVRHFISKLLADNLLKEVDDVITANKIDITLLPNEYTPPVLETFDDLQELFLLDPIHEVDEKMGWPHKPVN